MPTRRNAIKNLCAGTLGFFGINKVSAEVANWKEMDSPQEEKYLSWEDVLKWINEDLKYGLFENLEIDIVSDNPEVKKIKTCSKNNQYFITVKKSSKNTEGYLGCTVSSLSPLEGENWIRGKDLADGSLCQETWNKIMKDIIARESS